MKKNLIYGAVGTIMGMALGIILAVALIFSVAGAIIKNTYINLVDEDGTYIYNYEMDETLVISVFGYEIIKQKIADIDQVDASTDTEG